MVILETTKLTKRFGGLNALKDFDLKVEQSEILGVIGPNGAGKSTLFNVLSGVIQPNSGNVFFQGDDITGMKPYKIAAKGLIRTFQATRLFSNLSVLENVRIACHVPAETNLVGDLIGLASIKRRESEMRQRAIETVKLAGLETASKELAMNLPHGYQRALGVAIGLAAQPKLLCLDEPVTGMNIEESRFMVDFIRRIAQEGITVLLVEHAMRVVMEICQRIVVLNFGMKIAEGTPDEILQNQDVIEAYFGGPEENAA